MSENSLSPSASAASWSVRTRLLACFALVLGLLLVLSAYSVHVTKGIDAALSANSKQNTIIQRAAIDFRGSVHDRSIALRDAVHAPGPAARAEMFNDIERLRRDYAQAAERLSVALREGGDRVPREVHTLLQSIQEWERKGLTLTDAMLQQLRSGDDSGAVTRLWNEARPLYVEWLAAINRLIDFEEQRINANNQDANAAAGQFGAVMLWSTVLAVALGIAATVVLSRSISRELGGEPRTVRAVVRAMQSGDLTVQVPVQPGDRRSVMAAVHEMRQRFYDLVATLDGNVQTLRVTSQEVAASHRHLGERTDLTSQRLSQTAQDMDAFTQMVERNAEAAQQAGQLAQDAQDVASQGGALMEQVVDTMQEIHQSSQKIADIIGVIDGIAFQTNILALNAAVEAARAGEQGRGFAVVAGEVRMLAQRSAEAAQQIKRLIENSVGRVDAGSTLVEAAGRSMQGIVEQVQRVSGIIGEIGESARAQAQGIVSVHAAVAELEGMTQQNGQLVEQGTTTAAQLEAQAHSLATVVSAFQLDRSKALGRTEPLQLS